MIGRIKKALSILLWDFTQIKHLFRGVAVAYEHKYILSKLEFSLLIDVGANKGQFSLFAKSLNKGLKICAFEPLSLPAEKFKSVLGVNEDVVLKPYAVGEVEGRNTIHVSKKDDSSSLFSINEIQGEIHPGTEESHTETVEVKRLDGMLSADELVKHKNLLKIDVQGYELSVLKSAGSLLKEIQFIYVECSYIELYDGQPLANDVLEFLLSNNYEVLGVYNSTFTRDGEVIQSDFLFKNKAH